MSSESLSLIDRRRVAADAGVVSGSAARATLARFSAVGVSSLAAKD